MPTCVECGQAVPDLYREFSKGNIRLTQCVRPTRRDTRGPVPVPLPARRIALTPRHDALG